MTSVFNPYSGPSAEGTLQQGWDDSARTALAALRALLRDRAALPPPQPAFPQPDLEALAAGSDPPGSSVQSGGGAPPQPFQPRRNDDPDSQRAGLDSQVVAQTAALLAAAYGDGRGDPAPHYRIETLQPLTGPARYSLYDRHDHRILTFDREGTHISIRDDQLSEAHKADFWEAAQWLDQQGLPETPQQVHELLGALGPAHSRADYQARVTRSAQQRQRTDAFATPPTPQQAHRQEQAKLPVTPHDLAEWRMASVTLGRAAAQVTAIEAHAQMAASLAGARDFNQLYQRDKQAPLALQLSPDQRMLMDRELAQFRDLVRQNGPRSVEQLYQLQSAAESPTWIAHNPQVHPSLTTHQPAGPER